jgi:hypothetical protein
VVGITGARRDAALGAWLTTLVAFGAPAWAQAPAWLAALAGPGPLIELVPDADARHEAPADESLVPPLADLDLSILTTTVADREPTDLRLLVSEGERWRLMELGAAVTLRPLEAKLTAFGRLPYAVVEPAPGIRALNETYEPAATGITAVVGGFETGVQYRSAGKRLERLMGGRAGFKDREGHEVWVAQRFGVLRFRLADSALTDNVDRNPALPRTTRDETALTTELALDGWPTLRLTVASGESERVHLTRDARDLAPERHDFESITGSAYYSGGPAWSLSASSTFSRSRHAERPDDGMAMAYHDLSLTLHPITALTVTPWISLMQERYEPSGLGMDTGTAALTVSYAPRASRWSAWSYASYTTARASDASTDARSVSVTGILTYGLGRWLPGCSVSVETSYDRYVNAAFPGGAVQSVSGFVVVRLAAF